VIWAKLESFRAYVEFIRSVACKKLLFHAVFQKIAPLQFFETRCINQSIKSEFLTWLEWQKSLQRQRKRSRYVDSCSKMSGNDWWNKYAFSLWQKSVRDADDWISGGKLFQKMNAATGNEVYTGWPKSKPLIYESSLDSIKTHR